MAVPLLTAAVRFTLAPRETEAFELEAATVHPPTGTGVLVGGTIVGVAVGGAAVGVFVAGTGVLVGVLVAAVVLVGVAVGAGPLPLRGMGPDW